MAPDRERRHEILHARAQNERLAGDVTIGELARITPGLLGTELSEVVTNARARAARRGEQTIGRYDFEGAIEEITSGSGPATVLPETERWRIAYHEAGHALLGLLQPGAANAVDVSIFPRSRSTEFARHDPETERRLPGESYRRGRIIGLLGGLAAEMLVYGDASPDADADVNQAGGLARLLIARWGLAAGSGRVLPPIGIRDEAYAPVREPRFVQAEADEVDRVVSECYEHALAIVRENRSRLGTLARAVFEQETLRGPEVAEAAGTQAPAPTTKPLTQPHFHHESVPAMSRLDRVRYAALSAVWLAATASFWLWWLGHAAHSTPVLYWIQTVMLFYQATLLPTIYWHYVRRMRRPVEPEAPAGVRVALISLCVPAHESLTVIRKQLEALQNVTYPHDSWILDEGGSNDVRALAEEIGVHYFTRRGVRLWNQPRPPFQAKTKAGNVNAWLDHVASLGLEYEAFAQLDIDHRPRPDYLDRTLGYFRDAKVGWVQAPSVYRNGDVWVTRGLMEQDLVFHGPLQMGFYGATQTPFIIGSHTTYRTAAIRQIGGFQPTRAEDHLDTVVLAAHGYTGVFIPEVIATGDGPHNFATYLRQQFAWAYSMIQILIHHTPGLVRRYTRGQAFQFLFCQTWYTAWSVSLALLWALPTVALIAQHPIASVRMTQFLLYFGPVVLVSGLIWCETRKWFQPRNVKLSWRGILLGIARWPVVLWALINVVFRIKRPYMITPKGVDGVGPRALTLYGPAIALVVVPLAAMLGFRHKTVEHGLSGLFALSLANAALGLVLLVTAVFMEIKRRPSGIGLGTALARRAGTVVVVLALVAAMVFSAHLVWVPMTRVIS
jgi:cellulose synthase (UDP-forming)